MANNPQKTTPPAADAPPAGGTPAQTGAASGISAERVAEVEFIADLVASKLGAAIGKAIVEAQEAIKQSQRPGQFKKPPKRELPEEFKGSRTYIVGPNKAFQGGRLFAQGERITVVDQFPAKDWTPVDQAEKRESKPAPAKQGRAADQTVG